MSRLTRALAAIAVLALVGGACTRGFSSGSTNAQPPDLYAATPSLSDVRTLLGDDNNWWPGPPTFGVRPLDVASTPFAVRFSVTQPFVHVGTAETFAIDYTMYDATSSASSRMSALQTALGTSAVAGPKVGDQAIYYGSKGSGAAPYDTVTVVRVGQIVSLIAMNLKDGFPKLSQLGKIASRVVSRLKDVISGKLRGSSMSAFDATALPPAGLDITLLGTARISVETAVLMIGGTSVDALAQALRLNGVNDVVFGDYALNSDTHMEVRASVFNFATPKDATDWLNLLRGTYAVDQAGIAAFYDAAQGEYMLLFAASTKGALLICRSTADTEAASRACEGPLSRVISAWKLALGP